MIPYFKNLGQQIEQAWLERSYDEEIFPQLAFDALERDSPAGHVEVGDIIDWVFAPFQTFRQPSNKTSRNLFGEPPVLLFQAPRFYIEALFWFSGTTDIHEHAFSGAFTVLAGSSVHSHWRFAPERTINSRMLCGRLERVSTEILRPGGIRQIHSGDRLIHQLFHLDLPSVTIVVRTYQDRHRLPQYRYLSPGLALDPDEPEELQIRRRLLLDAMARGQIDGLRKYATRLIENTDLETVYYMFSLLTRRKVDRELLRELYSIAHQRHGGIADLFHQVCEGERRTRMVAALRSKVYNPEARFLLALLMLMPDRNSIFETIRLQFPDTEPMVAIEACVEGMSGKDTIGFEFNDVNRLIFRSLVEGLDTEGLLERLRVVPREGSIDGSRDLLLAHAKQMARLDLFYPLLSVSPLGEEVHSGYREPSCPTPSHP